MAEYDLTSKLGQYLDLHLVFPLMEFLSSRGLYDEQELQETKLDLLNHTNMVDFAIDVHKQLKKTEEAPKELMEKREVVVAEMKQLQASSTAVTEFMIRDDVQELIASSRDNRQLVDVLSSKHGLTQGMIDVLYRFGKFQYECGNYTEGSRFLSYHRLFISPNDKNYLNNLWGKLACEILMQQWTSALEDFNKLVDFIDNSGTEQLESLQQRTWLIHWSLFIYFNHAEGRDMLIDLFLSKTTSNLMNKLQSQQQPYLNAIQTICPHTLRYLTAAVITNRRRRELINTLVKVIQQESYCYRDPLTEFIEALCLRYDFEDAQIKLRQCQEVFDNDFFLVALKDSFIENARLFLFEVFCQVCSLSSIMVWI